MKKVFMKSFLGVPVAIFLYEIINILFSIFAFEGQYFRLDAVNEFNLNQVIIVYIELAVLGHLLTFLTLYTSYLNYTEKNEIQKARKDAKISFNLSYSGTFSASNMQDSTTLPTTVFSIVPFAFNVIKMFNSS